MSDSVLNEFDRCTVRKQETCTITKNGVETTYTKIISNQDVVINKYGAGGELLCLYNPETKIQNCDGFTSTAAAGEYWITNNLGTPTEAEAKSEKTCASSTYSLCTKNGDAYEAAKLKCEEAGGRLGNLAELEIARLNGKLTPGWIYASEDKSSVTSYGTTSKGNVRDIHKSNGAQIFCIGE